jgi:2,4-diaminopentanoate dehydrogenase
MDLRVAQWATGAVGREAMLGILGAPGLTLVGVKVTSSEKDGLDVGALLGRESTGVVATLDLDRLLAADPACVVYAPRTPSLDEVCHLLGAGVDVVTTAFGFHPRRAAGDLFERLDVACRAGRSTFHASGLNPGSFSAALPLALSGLVRRLEKVTLQERADWSVYESTDITFGQMRFGRPAEEVSEDRSEALAFTSDLFRQQVWLLGDALRAELDEVVTTHEVAVAATDVLVFDDVVAAGTVNGQRFRWVGRTRGEDRVEIEAIWTLGEVQADWPTPPHGWTLRLEGDPSVHAHLLTMASLSKPKGTEDHVRAASVATAMQVVNAIPHVCAAAPGIVTAADLPVVRSLSGFGG